IGICGDVSMRAPRSLLQVLAYHPVQRVSIFSPSSRLCAAARTVWKRRDSETKTDGLNCSNLDVLYMAGLPERNGKDRLGAEDRRRFALTRERLCDLPENAIVLSPMPVIDEIADDVRSDSRIRMFEQSRDATAVRMAVLEYVLTEGD